MIHLVGGPAARPVPAPSANDRLKETAQEFEAVFLEKLLSQMQSANQALSGREQNFARGIYESWQSTELARSIARAGGVGLAEALYRQMVVRG